jgi:colanic acid biosynthesis glycosyl transferase WcaI
MMGQMRADRARRIILVEQYFYPDGWGGAEIPRDIAIALSRAGMRVDVLCGTEQYAPLAAEAAGPNPTEHGVGIVRIPRILPGAPRSWRAVRILWLCLCAAVILLGRRGVRLIITQTNPPLIVPTVALVAALLRVPFIIIAQDVYPEVLFASRVTRERSLPGRCLARLFSAAYRRANRVVVLGPFMQRRIRAKGVDSDRIITVSNWATGEIRRHEGRDNPLRPAWSLEDRFVVLYSGNLGVGHEFDTYLEGARLAVSRGVNLTTVFVGGGSRLAEVRARTQALGLAACTSFHDYVAAAELPWTMGLAHLALVTLRDGFEGLIVPSKLLGYMARGIPTLYVGPESDVAQMIRETEGGVCCPPGAAAAVAEVLTSAAADTLTLRRWGENARACYAARFARELGLGRYVELASQSLALARP